MDRPFDMFFKRLVAGLTAGALALAVTLPPAYACEEEAMLVFDASGSMAAIRDGMAQIDIAREATADVLPNLTATRPTGLVTYGGEPGQGCSSVSLRLPPMKGSGDLINGELAALQPSGSTPLTEAVWAAVLAIKDSGKPGTVVLVTDGKENCGFNACDFGAQMAAGAKHIKVHVIGFYLRASAETNVACLASRTSGTYTSVHGLDALKKALEKTLSCPRIS